jgi:hypothetical protein
MDPIVADGAGEGKSRPSRYAAAAIAAAVPWRS